VAIVGSADARARRHHHGSEHRSSGSSSYSPPYAAIVVDGNTGQVLHASNPDAQRHPASLTKVMTLYLLFEQLEAGRLKLDSRLPVSAHAAAQSPTKLELKAGQTLAVEDALKGMVTKSANDAAVVVAEAIGGSEENFGQLMTRKARALGMSRTVYVNASGLPNNEQLTTARDQATLGRAIQERFPRYYRYFSIASFAYHGVAMRNHNHLLGRVEGVDGIKTGYTRDSGFNLLSSVHRGGRHIVAVVLGGSSAGARDARMRDLIERHVVEASLRRTAPMVAESAPVLAPQPPRGPHLASAAHGDPAPAATVAHKPAPTTGSSDPIKPLVVRTIQVKPAAVRTAAIAPLVVPAPQASFTLASAAAVPAPAPAQPASAPQTAVLQAAPPTPPAAPAPQAAPHPHGEWAIQIGAFPDESQARERLRVAQDMARTVLGHADPFTEKVVKGSKELYRARFAGFDRDGAEAACHYFKRNDIACMALKN
jgi:D-alanyl-D-alanine carboxypeptidase